MQRASSAADFSNLLNPLHPEQEAPLQHRDDQLHLHRASASYPDVASLPQQRDMAAAASVLSPPLHPVPHGHDEQRQDLPRPYKCPLCDKAFHRLEHQTRHIRTHTGEKPHACQHPGCTKRFSRSDELTRHSRIHNNPNGRRGNKSQHNTATIAAAAVLANGGLPDAQALPYPMPHPHAHAHDPRSASSSSRTSPNVSPPHSNLPFSSNTPSMLGPYNRSNGDSPTGQQQPLDINLLVTAASQVERDSQLLQPQHALTSRHQHHQHHPHLHHPYGSHGGTGRLPSLSAYAFSAQSMSRSHSHEYDSQSSQRLRKRSRPGSPISTAPSSPTFSIGSFSPTPDHTPLATPAHSPRLRPHGLSDVRLPTIHHLSLQHQPALAPMEPQADASQPSYVPSRNSSIRLSEIMSRSDGAQRKLPVPTVPKVCVHDLLNVGSGISSGRSSTAGSIAGADLHERM